MQQQFEAAVGLSEEGKWQEALSAWEKLEQRLANSKSGRSTALVQVRKAEALVNLDRLNEAETALRLGLPSLPENDNSLVEDRYLAQLTLGAIAERRLDYGEAVIRYRAAAATTAEAGTKISALGGAVRTGMFFDPVSALRDADEALSLVAADNDSERGAIRSLRARVLLNTGRFKEAHDELSKATKELGGLTLKVDIADLAVRSDNAIAAFMAGREVDARRYLAYTGAGRLPENIGTGAEMTPPPCGGEDNLQPDDVAVIEFSILDDGSVGRAAPVYSSRSGSSALAFARAVRDWSWKPEEVSTIPLFFRRLTRIELRCSTSITRPSIVQILQGEVDAWLSQRGVQPFASDEGADARRLKPMRDELARREQKSGPSSIDVVPLLIELAANAVTPYQDRSTFLRRALAIARGEKAPATVLASIGMRLALCPDAKKCVPYGDAANVGDLLADPQIESDPRAMGAIRLFQADQLYLRGGKRQEAREQLVQIRDGAGLARNDPIRAGAMIRLASLELVDGNQEGARMAFVESGLDAQQCALLDSGPRLHSRKSANYFPMEALQWGFEGWVRTEFDISAEGKTVKPRVVVAYPPFVFNKSATDLINRSRYEQSFRPDGGLGCGGVSSNIRFVIP